jgi:hypothetical protein
MRLPVASLLLLLAISGAAQAYVGPGAGISLIGSVIGFFAVLGTALGIIIISPIRAARKRAKLKQTGQPPSA